MTGFPAAPLELADPREHRRRIAQTANLALRGKLNATLAVTLAANQATTTVNDARITASSFVGFCPLTANAAAEIGAGGLYVSALADGQLTLTHANNAQTDRDFRLLIIG